MSSIGLAYNDLKDRIIVVEGDWHIVGVLDWDLCAHGMRLTEYRARIHQLSQSVKRWSFAFLANTDGYHGASVETDPIGREAELELPSQPLASGARATHPQFKPSSWFELVNTNFPYANDFRVALVLANHST